MLHDPLPTRNRARSKRDTDHRLPLFDDLDLPTDVAADHGQARDAYQQRAQAELIPAAFAFWWLGYGRLGLHGRIIPDRGQPEQVCSPRPDTGDSILSDYRRSDI